MEFLLLKVRNVAESKCHIYSEFDHLTNKYHLPLAAAVKVRSITVNVITDDLNMGTICLSLTS